MSYSLSISNLNDQLVEIGEDIVFESPIEPELGGSEPPTEPTEAWGEDIADGVLATGLLALILPLDGECSIIPLE